MLASPAPSHPVSITGGPPIFRKQLSFPSKGKPVTHGTHCHRMSCGIHKIQRRAGSLRLWVSKEEPPCPGTGFWGAEKCHDTEGEPTVPAFRRLSLGGGLACWFLGPYLRGGCRWPHPWALWAPGRRAHRGVLRDATKTVLWPPKQGQGFLPRHWRADWMPLSCRGRGPIGVGHAEPLELGCSGHQGQPPAGPLFLLASHLRGSKKSHW